MSKHNPFRVINADEADPKLEAEKAIIKQVLNDLLAKVDEEGVEAIAVVAITGEQSVIFGRHIHNHYHMILGALEKQKHDVIQLLEQTNYIASENEY